MKSEHVRIVQISTVVEPHYLGDAETMYWNEDATIYGLGDDGNMYFWGVTKTNRVEHTTEEELIENDYEKYHYEKEYGWRPHC